MSWVKIDDQLHTNEKALDCSLAARGLWLMCLSWVGDKETDGAIPRSVVRLHAGPQWQELSEELVSAGLWDVTETGWQFHDYLSYNKSHEELEADRNKAKDRMARVRGERRPQQETRSEDVRPNVPRSSATPVPVPVPVGNGSGAKRSAVVEPSADQLSPPPSSPSDSEQKLPTADPDAMRLYEAFRSVRFPKSIPTDWQPGEWHKDLPNLRQMARRGISPAQVIERTERAIARGFPSVTLNAVWNNWGDLGEDLPTLPEPVPKRLGRGESIAHAAAALDDDYAALEAAYQQKELAA